MSGLACVEVSFAYVIQLRMLSAGSLLNPTWLKLEPLSAVVASYLLGSKLPLPPSFAIVVSHPDCALDSELRSPIPLSVYDSICIVWGELIVL